MKGWIFKSSRLFNSSIASFTRLRKYQRTPGAKTRSTIAIEAKIAELEAKNEVIQELRSDADKEAEVAAAFRKLDAATGVDDQLAALKAKLAATKSLSSGESS